MPISIAWRTEARARLRTDRFDLVVIGGGINGCGIARDAALRGLRCALVERDDFASGTSSRSSRLVHGGVRYLEHGFFHLVFESSRERRILLRIAPHLVRPLAFTWPVYQGARISRWKLAAALWMYDGLAMFRNVARHQELSAEDVLEREPFLATAALLGGARYFDALTDDARLTLANVVDAERTGAQVLNHAEVTSLRLDHDHVAGVVARDRFTGEELSIRAAVVVNATGPWTDTIGRLESPSTRAGILRTKGVHIAVPADRVSNRAAITVLSPVDGRVTFVLPAGAHTIIGTTDTATSESPDQVRASRGDVQYLLDGVNACFPAARLTPEDVVAAWAGIRPLIASGNAGEPAEASREHEVVVGPHGLITVTGGKLTTFRSMSAEVVNRVQRRLGRRVTPTRTASLPLPEVGLEFACTIADVLVRRTKLAFETRDHGMSAAPGVAAELSAQFGWNSDGVARALQEYGAEVDRLFTIEP